MLTYYVQWAAISKHGGGQHVYLDYFRHEKLHRTAGPALLYQDGRMSWYEYGIRRC